MAIKQELTHRLTDRCKDNRARTIFYVLCFVVLFLAGYFLVHRPWFAFGRIAVEGGKALTVEDVVSVAGIQQPINLFTVDRAKLEHVLSHDLRVEKVTTKYAWPNILEVIITDRRPAGYFVCAYGGFAKVDYNGLVLSVGKGIKDASAPFVEGYELGNVYSGDKIADEDVLQLLQFLSKLDQAITAEIVEIVLDKDANIEVVLSSGLPIKLGKAINIESKRDTFVTVCNELKTKKINAQYIDLSFNKPFVKVN